jgi:3-dehydroquinate synthase
MLDVSEAQRISALVRRIGPLPSICDLAPARIRKLFARDKKAVAGQIHWVVPEKIGKVSVVSDVPIEAATEALRSVQLSEVHG